MSKERPISSQRQEENLDETFSKNTKEYLDLIYSDNQEKQLEGLSKLKDLLSESSSCNVLLYFSFKV